MKPSSTILACLVALLFATSGCSSIRTRHNFQPQPIPKVTGVPTATELFQQASARWWDAEKKEQKKATFDDKKAFLAAGLNLSDELADAWLKVQFRQDTDSRYWKNNFNTALSLSTAALGWAAAGSKVITAVGASGAAINSGWNNYEAAYLLSSSMPKVIDKLKTFRRDLRAKIERNFEADEYSYIETRMLIDQYHDTISRESVKHLIDSSIDLAKAFYAAPGTEVDSSDEVTSLNKQIYEIVYPAQKGAFSHNELIALRIWSLNGRESAIVKKLADKPAYAPLFDRIGAMKGEEAANFARILGQIDQLASLSSKADAVMRSFDTKENGAIERAIRLHGQSRLNFQPQIKAREK